MTVTLIILSVVLAILSGIFNAITDLSSEGKIKVTVNKIKIINKM